MKLMKLMTLAIMGMTLLIMAVATPTMSYFSDTETSTNNTVKAAEHFTQADYIEIGGSGISDDLEYIKYYANRVDILINNTNTEAMEIMNVTVVATLSGCDSAQQLKLGINDTIYPERTNLPAFTVANYTMNPLQNYLVVINVNRLHDCSFVARLEMADGSVRNLNIPEKNQ